MIVVFLLACAQIAFRAPQIFQAQQNAHGLQITSCLERAHGKSVTQKQRGHVWASDPGQISEADKQQRDVIWRQRLIPLREEEVCLLRVASSYLRFALVVNKLFAWPADEYP